MRKIVHLTSVHNRYDNRILIKQCSSLAKVEGYDVHLIVADGRGEQEYQGIDIIDLGKPKNRIVRFLQTIPKLTVVAIKQKAAVYHFHDPELIFTGLILRLFGRKVIYDVHEDYVTSIRQKAYLNRWVRKGLANVFDYFERFAAKFFHVIIAEKYYRERFPSSLDILNYPVLDEDVQVDIGGDLLLGADGIAQDIIPVIYTGNVTKDRGAIEHACMVKEVPHAALTTVGKCSAVLAKEMQDIAGDTDRLTIIGIDQFVTPEEIKSFYLSKKWIAGMALFPKTEHYAKKELTKFFEYMKFGIPIVCTNFPAWETFVEENKCGVAVDSANYEEIRQVLTRLHTDVEFYEEFSKNGRQRYIDTYNWSVEEKKLFNLYKNLL